jgi:ribose-phosphate pyrophosphokinase
MLMAEGARAVYACVTHGVLSGNANEVLDNSPIKKLFVTDTISLEREVSDKVEVVSVAEVFAEAIRRIEAGESLSELFATE